MTWEQLGVITALLTLAGAFVGWLIKTQYIPRRNGKRLRTYLKRKRRAFEERREPTCRHSAHHLSAELGLSPDKILEASNFAPGVERTPSQNERGLADGVMYEYTANDY